MKLDLMIMSGVEDGLVLGFDDEKDGRSEGGAWTLSVGRSDDNTICLRNDTYISRQHAYLHYRDEGWWLEDNASKNGTYVEAGDEDMRVSSTVALQPGQLFRVGRTWLRIQTGEGE